MASWAEKAYKSGVWESISFCWILLSSQLATRSQGARVPTRKGGKAGQGSKHFLSSVSPDKASLYLRLWVGRDIMFSPVLNYIVFRVFAQYPVYLHRGALIINNYMWDFFSLCTGRKQHQEDVSLLQEWREKNEHESNACFKKSLWREAALASIYIHCLFFCHSFWVHVEIKIITSLLQPHISHSLEGWKP